MTMQNKENDNNPDDLNDLLKVIIDQSLKNTKAEHSILYLYDEHEKILWSRASNTVQLMEIEFKFNKGIPGKTIDTGIIFNISNPKKDKHFNPKIDQIIKDPIESILSAPIIDSQSKKIGVIQLINKSNSKPFNSDDEHFIEAICAQAAIAIEKTILFHSLEQKRNQELLLNQEIKDQNRKLQDAYMQIAQSNKEISSTSKKLNYVRNGVTIASILLFGIIGYIVWNSDSLKKSQPTKKSTLPQLDVAKGETLKLFTVKTRPFDFSFSLTGTLEPGETINLFAPFKARIKEKNFTFNESVSEGQILLTLETDEIESKYRNAKIDLLEAENHYKEILNWEKSPKMIDAQRDVIKYEETLEEAQERFEVSDKLFKIGIESEDNWKKTKKNIKDSKLALTKSKEKLKATEKEGNEQAIQIASYKLENKKLVEQDLQAKLNQATILSPISGVIIEPLATNSTTDSSKKNKEISSGVILDEGSIFGSVADLSALSVLGKVDEIDIRKVKIGQPVLISGDAFPGVQLKGTVTYVSSQAKKSSRTPYFEVRVKTEPITEKQQKIIRLGMTATLRIVYYSNPNAILIPFSTIDKNNIVYKINPETQKPEPVTIRPGKPTTNELEVLSGLNPGDQIVILK